MIDYLVVSEGDESPVAEVRRMMKECLMSLKRSLKRTYKNNSMIHNRTWIKTREDTETAK
jgi:hypothetical protein